MTRLNYHNNKETGMFVTRKPVMSNKGLLVVTIDPKALTYSISKYDTSEVLSTGKGRNFHEVKKVAKESLSLNYGSHFNDEVRNRVVSTTVPPKEVVNG